MASAKTYAFLSCIAPGAFRRSSTLESWLSGHDSDVRRPPASPRRSSRRRWSATRVRDTNLLQACLRQLDRTVGRNFCGGRSCPARVDAGRLICEVNARSLGTGRNAIDDDGAGAAMLPGKCRGTRANTGRVGDVVHEYAAVRSPGPAFVDRKRRLTEKQPVYPVVREVR